MNNYLPKMINMDELINSLLILISVLLTFTLVGCTDADWTVTMVPIDTDIRNLILSPDGTLLAASRMYGTSYKDIEVLIFNVNQPLEDSLSSPITRIDYPGVELAWSPDGSYLVIGGAGDIAIWSIEDQRIIQEYRVIPTGLDLSSATPKRFLWLEPGDRLLPIYLINLPLVDPYSGQITGMLEGTGSEWLCGGAWTSEGHLIAVSTTFSHSKLRIWDSDTTELLHVFEYNKKVLCPLEWSSSGQKLVFRYGETSIMLWDAQSGSEPEEMLQLDSPAYRIAWSPNGRLIAFGSMEGILTLWDVEQSKVVFQEDLKYQPDHVISSLVWLPDSHTLITSGETVVIWNITEP